MISGNPLHVNHQSMRYLYEPWARIGLAFRGMFSGNHDVVWMGSGRLHANSIIRMNVSYNTDMLEHQFASEATRAQQILEMIPCARFFMPHTERNDLDPNSEELAAKMHKDD